jgi:hypothetical protein
MCVLSALIISCADQNILLRKIPKDQQPTAKILNVYYFGGLDQKSVVTPASICGGDKNIAKITYTKSFFWEGFISLITLGIVTPRHTEVYCVKPA